MRENDFAKNGSRPFKITIVQFGLGFGYPLVLSLALLELLFQRIIFLDPLVDLGLAIFDGNISLVQLFQRSIDYFPAIVQLFE